MARPQVTDEGTVSKWRVAANILNKQMRTADKELSSRLGLGEVLIIPRPKNGTGYETDACALGLD